MPLGSVRCAPSGTYGVRYGGTSAGDRKPPLMRWRATYSDQSYALSTVRPTTLGNSARPHLVARIPLFPNMIQHSSRSVNHLRTAQTAVAASPPHGKRSGQRRFVTKLDTLSTLGSPIARRIPTAHKRPKVGEHQEISLIAWAHERPVPSELSPVCRPQIWMNYLSLSHER